MSEKRSRTWELVYRFICTLYNSRRTPAARGAAYRPRIRGAGTSGSLWLMLL